ncbi:hypothetical protein BH09GEM1_BH09GEM1_38910 [soil metagenome]
MLTPVFRRLLLLGAVAAALPTPFLRAQTVTVRSGSTLRRQVAPGATVAVPVVLDLSSGAGTNVSSLSLGVAWRSAQLRFDSLKAGSFGAVTSNLSGAGTGSLITSVFSAVGTTSTITMATAYFTAAATTGGTRISFNPTVAGSDGGVSVLSRFRTQPLDVCVAASGFWGDANGDNSVNIIDAQQIARYSVGLSVVNVTALTTQSDVNADGDVNIIDAQQIARFSVELPAAPRVNGTLFVQPTVDFISLGTVPAGPRVGGSIQLAASIYDSIENPLDGCAPVAWTSSNPAVATVDSTGRVLGVTAGSVVITATAGTASNAAELTVGGGAGSAASIAILAGDQQWGFANNPLPVAAQVVVLDSIGAPVANAPVTFTVSAGTLNSGTPLTVNTDASGVAMATKWYAPAAGATATMKASVGGAVPDATLGVNLLPSIIGQTSCMYDVWGNRCWGNGTRGQLGNGTSTSSLTPVVVNPDLTGFRISAGGHFGDHFCGLDSGGAAYCWGSNNGGQLGDGTRIDRNVPTAVTGGLTFSMLATGTQHTCGVTTAGDVYCWGIAYAGQLGDSTVGTSRVVPTKAKTPAGLVFTQVSAGYNHTCATTVAGDVYCWGINSFGQLGDGTISSVPRPYPALITGGLKLTKIAAGPAGGCGLTAAGAAWCWGSSSNGQLGNGSLTTSPAPVLVQGGHVFSAITMGINRTCGEKGAFAENTVWCWGANSSALTDGTFIDRSIPTLIPYTLSQLSQFGFSGIGHACGLAVGGSQVFCSGANTSGQLGDGTTTTHASANAVIRAGATAGAVTFMQPTGGNTMVPQSSAAGTLVPIAPEVVVGDGSSNPIPGVTVTWMVQTGGGSVASATSVTDARGFASSGGWTLGAAVGEQKLQATVSGVIVNGAPAPNLAATFIAYGTNTPALAVKISGDSGYSSTNNGGSPSVPQVVKVLDASSNPIPNVVVTFTLGTSSGSLRSGGSSATITTDANGLAALPVAFWIPNTAQPSTSTLTATVAGMGPPLIFTHFRAVGNFDVASCGLTAAGAAMCAGLNTYGGVGDGTTTNRSTFTAVSGGLTFTSLAEGISTTKCGLVGTKAYCWGLNSMGSVGDSTLTNRLVPTAVTGGLSFTKLFTQSYTSCGLTTSNKLYCWGFTGDPGWGEGEGMRGRIHPAPTLVNTDGLTFTKIGLSDNGMCGLTSAGAILCRDRVFRGDGGTAIPTTFIQWPGGPWTDISMGNTVACALDAAGHAFCIGSGGQGSIGIGSLNGTTVGSSVPAQVLGGISFADIHAANFRACARRSSGELYCWGITPGDGTALADRPSLLRGLTVSSVRMTTFRNECAKTTTSLLYCWGSNSSAAIGTVGDGTTIDRVTPVAIPNWPDGPPAGVAVTSIPNVTTTFSQVVSQDVPSLPSVTVKDRLGAPVVGLTVTFTLDAASGSITGGTAVTDASGVATIGSWTMPSQPGTVRLVASTPGVPSVTFTGTVVPPASGLSITAGNDQYLPDFLTLSATISVKSVDAAGDPIGGTPVTFAFMPGNGALNGGGGTLPTQGTGIVNASWFVPIPVGATYSMSATALGAAPLTFTAHRLAWSANGASNPSASICRLNAAGAAYCWGGNVQGQVGDGSNSTRIVPTAVSAGITFASLARNDVALHNCGLTAAGAAYCWGNNDAGQLGNGTQTNSNVPVAVSGGLSFTSLGSSPYSTCGLASGGTMYCWGWGGWSFRGDGEIYTVRTVPTSVNTGGRTFTSISVGGRMMCGLDVSGQAFCWGENASGQLGIGTTASATIPQAVATGLRFTQLASGFDFTCGITTSSTVACWGLNNTGQLGVGSTVNQLSPVELAGITGALEVRTGERHACARTTTDVYCWGVNGAGQVGDGTTTSPRTSPVKVALGIAPMSLAAISLNASCVNTTKQLYCWGASTSIGDGTFSSRSSATAVQWPETSTSDVASINAITPTSITASASTPQTVTVQVTNAFGTTMSGVSVDFVVTSGGGSVSVGTAVTDASGRANTGWTLTGSTGTVGKLETRVAGIPTRVFTGTVGSASGSMSITGGDNQYLPDYFSTSPGLQVKVVDGAGNPIANATVTFTAAPGSGTVSPAAVNTVSDGTATYYGWTTPNATGTAYTLQASVSGLAPVAFSSRRLAYLNNPGSNLFSTGCRLNSSGAAYCWGGNAQGQVGDGTTTNRTAPVAVATGLTFTALGNGSQGFHNCALVSGGVAYCWGANAAGQLGNGTQSNSNVPVAVAGGLAFKSLSTGALSTCGITTANALYCWGWGGYSFRGDSAFYNIKTTPTAVSTVGRTFVSVSVGRSAICALDAAGQAFCWGENWGGQLGSGSGPYSYVPVATATALRFSSLSLGVDHACGVTTSNTVACWGANSSGAVGNGTTTNQLSPQTVAGVDGAVEVRSGEAHSCARTATEVYCWGANFANQVGDGTTTNRTTPQLVLSGVATTSLPSFGRWLSCASTAFQLSCWGTTEAGVGDGSAGGRPVPTAISGTDGPVVPETISAAEKSSCGLTVSGSAYCWGENTYGELGDGTTTNRNTPVATSGALSFASISASFFHTCGVTRAGDAYCWGNNINGQLGDGTNTTRSTPLAVTGGLKFASISSKSNHTCGVTVSGAAYCWGANVDGQLGDGTTTDRNTPTAVNGGLTFANISAGINHTCGLVVSGAAYCWGFNFYGQLGDGTATTRGTPVAVSGGLSFARISAAFSQTCGMTVSGAVYCWGNNFYGQLGDGTTTTRNTPVAVSGGLSFARISAGSYHTCGLTNAGVAYCWGRGTFGEVGDATATNRSTPVAVSGGSTFARISAGAAHTCGLTLSGAAYCWGYNVLGQVGDGTTTDRSTPVAVTGGVVFKP